MDEKLILEVEELLDKADVLIAEGKSNEAREVVAMAKSKIKRPIGSGTNGPEVTK